SRSLQPSRERIRTFAEFTLTCAASWWWNRRHAMNPLDLRSVLFAKHAQHVVLVHFPIALFLTGTLFDFAARYTRRSALARAASLNTASAAATVVPVVVTGLLAWQWQLDGVRLKGSLLLHLAL